MVTYRSIMLSSLSERKWAAAHCSLERLGLAGYSSSGWLGFPCDPECWRSSSGTVPEWTPSVWCPSPRSGASVASRLGRFAARASSLLPASPEKGAGAARRLNGLLLHRASGCCVAAGHEAHEQTSWGVHCCGDAAGTSTTCTPILFHC